jgi:hypothetical protein
MATWSEFESLMASNNIFTKLSDGYYSVTVGQGTVLVSKGDQAGAWANFTALIGIVPGEKLNGLLEAAALYPCGALIKTGDNLCVRYSYPIEYLSPDAFAATLAQTGAAAITLKNQFNAE